VLTSALGFTAFTGQYTGSRKEPDYFIIPRGLTLPTVVVESGWSETRAQLERDRDLWLQGGQATVQLVFILKWTKNATQQVSGDVKVYDRCPLGNVQLLQSEVG
jgi:hypothetical protein